MKWSLLVLLTAVVVLALAGCSSADQPAHLVGGSPDGTGDPAVRTVETTPGVTGMDSSLVDPSGNVVLFVVNGSIPGETLDIRIEIDGETVVDRDFVSDRGGGMRPSGNHGYYRLRLSPGRHVLRATSRQGARTLQRTFNVSDKLWVAVAYSYNTASYGTPSPRQFNIRVSEKEMGLL